MRDTVRACRLPVQSLKVVVDNSIYGNMDATEEKWIQAVIDRKPILVLICGKLHSIEAFRINIVNEFRSSRGGSNAYLFD
jgi:hypothetical protein